MRAVALYFLLQSFVIAADTSIADPALKDAALDVLSCWCGVEMQEPRYIANAKIVQEAGPRIIPVLVELLSKDDVSETFIGGAADVASRLPYSESFRNALRSRRDEKGVTGDPIAIHHIFTYLAAYGDKDDIAWIHGIASTLDLNRQRAANEAITKIETRLSKKPK